jgi:hypothetical protein
MTIRCCCLRRFCLSCVATDVTADDDYVDDGNDDDDDDDDDNDNNHDDDDDDDDDDENDDIEEDDHEDIYDVFVSAHDTMKIVICVVFAGTLVLAVDTGLLSKFSLLISIQA